MLDRKAGSSGAGEGRASAECLLCDITVVSISPWRSQLREQLCAIAITVPLLEQDLGPRYQVHCSEWCGGEGQPWI